MHSLRVYSVREADQRSASLQHYFSFKIVRASAHTLR